MRRFIGILAGIIVAASAVAPGRADVFEIDDHGSVHVRPASGEVQWVSTDAEPAADGPGNVAVPEGALTMMSAPRAPDAWQASLRAAADRYGISSDLLAALVWQESGWHPAALSAKGAMGLAQLMPGTARAMAIDAHDPAANLAGGAQYLRRMLDLFDGDVERALAAYNAGPGRVQRAGGVPRIAETQAYVSNILLRLTPAVPGETGSIR